MVLPYNPDTETFFNASELFVGARVCNFFYLLFTGFPATTEVATITLDYAMEFIPSLAGRGIHNPSFPLAYPMTR